MSGRSFIGFVAQQSWRIAEGYCRLVNLDTKSCLELWVISKQQTLVELVIASRVALGSHAPVLQLT